MEKQIMPEFRFTPRFRDMARTIGRAFTFLPDTPLSRGDHTFERNHGAAPMLDEQLELEYPHIEYLGDAEVAVELKKRQA